MKTTLGPQRLLFPLPTVLVVTGSMEKANIVTIAWISILTGNPPMLGISVGQKGYSGELIQQNKDFSVNIATVDIITEVDFCGITSGRDINKFEKTGLTPMFSSIIQSPIIKECPLNIECKLANVEMVGSTYHFTGEIVETHIDSDKIKNTHDLETIDLIAMNPLIYISGVREYRRIGEKVGDAYRIGKNIL